MPLVVSMPPLCGICSDIFLLNESKLNVRLPVQFPFLDRGTLLGNKCYLQDKRR